MDLAQLQSAMEELAKKKQDQIDVVTSNPTSFINETLGHGTVSQTSDPMLNAKQLMSVVTRSAGGEWELAKQRAQEKVGELSDQFGLKGVTDWMFDVSRGIKVPEQPESKLLPTSNTGFGDWLRRAVSSIASSAGDLFVDWVVKPQVAMLTSRVTGVDAPLEEIGGMYTDTLFRPVIGFWNSTLGNAPGLEIPEDSKGNPDWQKINQNSFAQWLANAGSVDRTAADALAATAAGVLVGKYAVPAGWAWWTGNKVVRAVDALRSELANSEKGKGNERAGENTPSTPTQGDGESATPPPQVTEPVKLNADDIAASNRAYASKTNAEIAQQNKSNAAYIDRKRRDANLDSFIKGVVGGAGSAIGRSFVGGDTINIKADSFGGGAAFYDSRHNKRGSKKRRKLHNTTKYRSSKSGRNTPVSRRLDKLTSAPGAATQNTAGKEITGE